MQVLRFKDVAIGQNFYWRGVWYIKLNNDPIDNTIVGNRPVVVTFSAHEKVTIE